jgi:hypothetical protein
MKVALFSDVITCIGEGTLPGPNPDATHPAPDRIVDGSAFGPQQFYTNLALQGGSSVLETHPEFAAAYVQNNDDGTPIQDPAAILSDVKMFDKPFSTEGA